MLDDELDGMLEEDDVLGYYDDDAMADEMAREEQLEIDAMISDLSPHQDQHQNRHQHSWVDRTPDSPYLSDDEDYDSLFMDMISNPAAENHFAYQSSQDAVCSSQMDLS